MNAYEICIAILLAILGACAASFINAAALRRVAGKTFVKGRSVCPACDQQLVWYELIPIMSWLMLAGKCCACGEPISPRYLIAELIGAAASALVFVRFGFSLMTPLAFAVMVLLLAVALVDLSTMEIPDVLMLALIPFAAVSYWIQPEITLVPRIIGFFAVSAPMFILAHIIAGAFGGGDVKLMAVCGFLLGWQNIVLSFFLGAVAGGLFAAALLIRKRAKKGTHIPFGPYLCIGIVVAQLYGQYIIDFYLRTFM